MTMYISDESLKAMEEHNAYFDKQFTGAEKIQMVIDEIRRKRDQLVYGDTVEIRSIDFHTNFDFDEQRKVLNLLQEKYKCIRYDISQDYENVSEMNPDHFIKLWITEDEPYPHYVDDISILEGYAFLCEGRFSVTILDNFDEAVKGLGTDNEVVYAFIKDSDSGRYYINNIPLGKPQDDSMTDKILKAAFKNENRFVYFSDIENKSHQKISLQKILNDFHLKKPVWSLFFRIEKDGFIFCPRITNKDIRERQINTKNVNSELSKI